MWDIGLLNSFQVQELLSSVLHSTTVASIMSMVLILMPYGGSKKEEMD